MNFIIDLFALFFGFIFGYCYAESKRYDNLNN